MGYKRPINVLNMSLYIAPGLLAAAVPYDMHKGIGLQAYIYGICYVKILEVKIFYLTIC